MSLIICSECGKEISNKSKVCIHCGNPIEKSNKTDSDLEYKSYYDLPVNERAKLQEQFNRRVEKSEERKIYTVLLVMAIIYGIFMGIGFFTTISDGPILDNGFFWIFLFCLLVLVVSCIELDKDNKDREQKFISWLDTSKHIKK